MLGSAEFEGMPRNAKLARADGKREKCVTLLDVCGRHGWHSHQNSALRSKTAPKNKSKKKQINVPLVGLPDRVGSVHR